MRILLTGRGGQIGWELERGLAVLGEVIATDQATVDLGDPDAVRRMVREAKPGLIVNAAGYTAVDRAESEPDLAMKVNGIAPGVLADEARRIGALLVHYSTDYIFDGEKRSSYAEGDAPNPLNTYGRTKLEGENRIAASDCRFLILRTSWVYAPRGKNFFLTIAGKLRARAPLRVVNDQHGVPSEAKFVSEMTIVLLQAQAEGIFNVVPYGATTWHGFAAAIAKRLEPAAVIESIPSSRYPTAARRPPNSVLDCAKLSGQLGCLPPEWEALLDRCVKRWSEDQR